MPKVEKYIARKRVRGTDFITGTDKDGNVVRFSGAFFIREIVNESNYLSLLEDEREARIAADELLDDKISVLGEQLGIRISQNESGLVQLESNINNELYGPGGITESYTSAITQSAESITLSVDKKLYGEGGITESYNSAITQTAESINLSVENMLYGPEGVEAAYTSMINQTATAITMSVDEKLYGPDGIEESYSSLIQQTAQSIVLSVESELYGPDGIQQKYTSAMQMLSDQIILTVDGTLNDFENEVYTEVGSIIQQSATDILLQVDGKIVDVKGEITTEYTSAISVAKGEIALTVDGQLTDLEDDITSAYQSAITVAKDEIGLSVSGQLTTLEGDITEAYESAISVAKDEIALTVDGQLTDLEDGITQAYESAIVVAKGEINMSVAGQLTALEGNITAAYESAIDISEGQILSTVGTQITDLDGRIASNTSSITQLSDSIDLSVFTNGVLDAGILIGKINDNTSGVRITGKSILLDGDVEITGTAFAENIYASGATLGGFTINETSLQLGTQAAWNPSSGTEGLLMGIDPLDSKYKFYLGDVENHLIWNGENLIISGFALIGDGSSTTTLNDLGKLEGYFEIVNEGQANEYLKLLAPLAVTGEVQAWASDPNVFPPNIWSSLPLASDTTLGAVRIGAGLSYNAKTGMISVDGSVGTGFDESSNYSPSGTWAFTGAVSVGGSPVATQAQLNAKANKNGSSTEDFTVKNLTVHGTVNHWLADVITIDDARLQLNRTQGAATVASGLDIYNGTSVVSSLLYDTSGIWRAGGQRIYTDAYKPDSDALGGYSAASYPRKAEAAVITGLWGLVRNGEMLYLQQASANQPAFIRGKSETGENLWYIGRPSGSSLDIGCMNYSNAGLWFGTNSVQRVRIDEVGFMGVGTVAPTERLHVAGNALFTGNLTANYGTFNGRVSAYGTTWSGDQSHFVAYRYNDNSVPIWEVRESSDGSVWNRMYSNGTERISFRTNGNSFILNNNFGLGTTSPTEKLHVAGNGRFTGNLLASGSVRIGDASQSGSYGTKGYIQTFGNGGAGAGYSGIEFNTGAWSHTGVLALYTSNGATSTRHNGLVVDNLGRVAIGKSTGAINADSMPAEALDVTGNALISGAVTAGGNITAPRFIGVADDSSKLGGVNASDWVRRTVAQTITGSWSFSGLPTINRSGQDVTLLRFNTERQWQFRQINSGASAGLALVSEVGFKEFDIRYSTGTRAASFFVAGSDAKVSLVPDGGSVSIGGNTTVSGNITAQGEVTAYSSSDKRLKSNITPITSSLSIIDKLNPVSFNWNEKAVELNNTKNTSSKNYGVIAQELEEVLPDLVHTTNGYKSVDYIQLIGVLLAGMRELNNKIKNLENK